MEPIVELILVLALAVGAIGLVVAWRRRTRKARRRREEIRALDERVAARLADLNRGLSGSGGGPITGPYIYDEMPRRSEPPPIPERPIAERPIAEPPPIAEPLLTSQPLAVETEALSSVQLAAAGSVAKKSGEGQRRRVIAQGAAAVAVIAVVVVLLASRLPLNPSSQPAPTASAPAVAVLPTGSPNLPSPTAGATPSPSAIPTPTPTPTPSASTAPTAAPNTTPPPTPLIYIVRLGDTMISIAATYGVSLEDLIAANPQIRDPSLIYAGNEITIPTPRPSPAVSPTPSAAP
jgi:LysM repeat protein